MEERKLRSRRYSTWDIAGIVLFALTLAVASGVFVLFAGTLAEEFLRSVEPSELPMFASAVSVLAVSGFAPRSQPASKFRQTDRRLRGRCEKAE